MKAEITTFKNVLKETAIYRTNTIASFLVVVLPMLFLLLFWNAAFQGRTYIAGFTRPQLFAYYLMILVLQDILMIKINYEVSSDIRSGQLSAYLLRPFHYIRHCFSVFSAVSFNYLLYTLLVIIPIVVIIFPSVFSYNPQLFHGLLSVALGAVIAFLLGMSLSCISFWMEDISSISIGLGLIVPVVSGAFLPLSFFPNWLRSTMELLPFWYTLAFPAEVLCNRLSTTQISHGLLIQVIWVVIGCIVLHLIWSRGKRVYTSYGA